MDITLQLTLPEVNKILDSLGSQPYKEVYELIAKIQAQATAQLSEQQSHPNGAREVQPGQ